MKIDLRRLVILLLVGAGAVLLWGCGQSPPGDTITVYAPPNDTVSWAAAPTLEACCPYGTCKNTDAAVVPSGPVGSDGLVDLGAFQHFVDYTNYTIASVTVGNTPSPTTCMGYTNLTVGCAQVFSLRCEPVPSDAAQGTVTVSGQEDVECWYSSTDIQPGPCPGPPGSGGKQVYNSGTVSVTFDGQTVSAGYNENSTATGAAGLATELALGIDENPTLSSQFSSAANGDISLVHGVNTGTQYDYSWTSSCTYNRVYFKSCSFTAGLSPAGSLSSPS